MDAKLAAELADTDAIGQAALAAAGEVSAAELLEAAIIRLDGARGLNAVITDLFERGRAQAAALDASGALRDGSAGPLAGVPFLLKDLGASLAGAPEAMGSRALRTHVARHTAWIVERYLDAGLVVFGKTNTPEWGNHCTTEPSAVRPHRQPVVTDDHARRFVGRIGIGGGRRRGAGRVRRGRHRIDPGARGLLRTGRAQAPPRRHLLRARRPIARGPGRRTCADPNGARQRRAARRRDRVGAR